MMIAYLSEIGLTFAAVLLLAGVGFGPAAALAGSICYPALAAPLIGIALLPLGTLAFYFLLHLPFTWAAILALVFLIAASIFVTTFHRHSVPIGDVWIAIALILAGCAIFAWLSSAATVTAGVPSILYVDGTDHLGYASAAQWLLDNLGVPPNPSGPATGGSQDGLTNLLISFDTRTAAFAFLALVALFRQVPPTFAYDSASAILLVAGVAGAAAVHARSYRTFLLLAFGLAASQWFELAHSGFLGKALGYPASLFLVGLFMRGRYPLPPFQTLIVAVVVAGAALLLSGLFTGLLLLILVGGSIAMQYAHAGTFAADRLPTLVLFAFLAVAANGFLAHPLFGAPLIGQGSSIGITVVAMDFEGMFTPTWRLLRYPLLILASGATIYLGRLAIGVRQYDAAALLLLPLVVFVAVFVANRGDAAAQMLGILYPTMLCGAVAVFASIGSESIGSESTKKLRHVAGLALAIIVAARLPHALASFVRYSSPTMLAKAYPITEIDALADAVGNSPVVVDLGRRSDVRPALVVQAEFGRRGIAVQWSEATWAVLVGSTRPWPGLDQPRRADLIVTYPDAAGATTPIVQTTHFALGARRPAP